MLSDEGDGEGRVRLFLLAPRAAGPGASAAACSTSCSRSPREAGYERLTLSTFSDLRAAAHLYRRAGFRVVCEEDAPRWGREQFRYQHYELVLAGPA